MRSRLTSWLFALVALMVSGCVMSPIPEPPQATLDVDKVFIGDTQGMRLYGIVGDPGAASPPGATIRVIHLDGQELPVEGIVEDNGSFMIELDVNEGAELRFQIVTDDYRFDPIDLIAGPPESNPVLAERALGDCLFLDPELEIDLTTTEHIVVENNCEHDVELSSPELRRPMTGIELDVTGSMPIVAPGESATVDVSVQPDFDIEDVLFITVIAPEVDRRPVTFVPP